MCTAATYVSRDHYFGRNLDLEYSYHEQVTVMPRSFPLRFRNAEADAAFRETAEGISGFPSNVENGLEAANNVNNTAAKNGTAGGHYALIGMALVAGGYPLFYDGINEAGLGMAGLNFPDNCDFREVTAGKVNVASFELIPWVLGSCRTVEDARAMLADVNVTNQAFSEKLPPNPLHWMIADRQKQIVVEQTKAGLKIYDNPVGVMTNNPTFDIQLTLLANYRNVTAEQGSTRFADGLDLHAYSRGMGGMGLPGDLSSASRFAKAAFTRMNSVSGEDESASVSQFFHILGSVEQQRCCCRLGEDQYEITIYSSCCNQDKGIYYYTTYENSQINAVDLHRENLDGTELATYDLVKGQQFNFQN